MDAADRFVYSGRARPISAQAANYAAWLAAQVKLSFPTATLAQQVNRA